MAPAPPQEATAPAGSRPLPQPIVNMITDINLTLAATFPVYPPHTIQRLSEMVLAPREHYRSLPAYLHALDRIIHVTSGPTSTPCRLPSRYVRYSPWPQWWRATDEPRQRHRCRRRRECRRGCRASSSSGPLGFNHEELWAAPS